jgi:methionyl-tRNA formyltransferase
VPSLQALDAAGHAIIAVYTQPDRPRGRGRSLRPSAVKQLALALNLPVRQPEKFAEEQSQQMAADRADLLVVVAFGQILPLSVLQLPRFGAVNVHASLLPRWRGAAPVQRALLSGDQQTGITLMQMDAGLDTGPMLLQKAMQVQDDDTAGILQDRLAQLGARCLIGGLAEMAAGQLTAVVQPDTGMTYAHKIEKTEANIDWSLPANTIDRQVRAFNPVPGAFSYLAQERIKFLTCEMTTTPVSAGPGTLIEVSAEGLGIATADRMVRMTRIQPAGGRPMAVKDFLNARNLEPGVKFSTNQEAG